ncbi:MAG: phosphatidate cytidylyltransferase [bacterium]
MIERIATGLVLAPAAVLLTLWSPPWLFAALTLTLMLAALAEWRRLMPTPYTALLILGALVIAVALALFPTPRKLMLACLAAMLLWSYHWYSISTKGMGPTPTSLRNLAHGALVLLFAWCALVLMRIEHGAVATVAMLAIIWSADAFAYFVGKIFGARQLAPKISPGKTVEGLIGGIVGAGVVALALAIFLLELSAAQTIWWLTISLAAALFAVIGDLQESRLKRRAGVKDSGDLLPGHGGILDRIDGLIAAAPAFAFLWSAAPAIVA